MEENKKGRIQLEDDAVEEVGGGSLKAFITAKGSTIKQYDDDFNVIGTFKVTSGNSMNVYRMLTGDYWNFDAGKRDEQCLEYMRGQGWIE